MNEKGERSPQPSPSRAQGARAAIADFRRAGHLPSLLGALANFDVSFVCWVILGALGVYIAEDLALTPSQKGLVVATPLLSAAVFRVLLGVLSDRYGPRRVGSVSTFVVLAPLAWGWLAAGDLGQVLGVGLLLGVAGASFAISLPLASRWYPPRYQGVVMGIAAAGNSGTVIAALFAPRLAEQVGWHGVMGLAMVPVALVWLTFMLIVREPPGISRSGHSLGQILAVMRDSDTWRFCGFYLITFGGFVGLASFLPIFFHDQYGLSKVDAGAMTALCAGCGSFIRPVGGLMADRLGGSRVLAIAYAGIALALLAMATLPPFAVAAVLLPAALSLLGVGNGATFQMVGLRFGGQIGAVTGIVGAAGGLGGFLLPTVLGTLKQAFGSYGLGLAVIAGAAAVALAGLMLARRIWLAEGGWARELAEARV